MMLAMDKDIQQKLIDEINEIYRVESDTRFGNDFLQKFTFLDAVLNESMRLFPPIAIIGREASDEVEIGGYLIPKGTSFLISIYAMHRDEKFWGQDANLFKPERFLEELINPHAFAPFSGMELKSYEF
jgi:cytochrome P450